jgi:hypothetical protein
MSTLAVLWAQKVRKDQSVLLVQQDQLEQREQLDLRDHKARKVSKEILVPLEQQVPQVRRDHRVLLDLKVQQV